MPEEEELRGFARRSIFATRDIRAGERLTRDNVAVLRCGKLGFGLAPEALDAVLGRAAVRPIRAETQISMDDLV